MHFQPGQSKLVRCARGSVLDVVVDLRRGSPTFGEWEAVELDAERHLQLYVPDGFAHGFCVLSDVADLTYKVSTYYDPAAEVRVPVRRPGGRHRVAGGRADCRPSGTRTRRGSASWSTTCPSRTAIDRLRPVPRPVHRRARRGCLVRRALDHDFFTRAKAEELVRLAGLHLGRSRGARRARRRLRRRAHRPPPGRPVPLAHRDRRLAGRARDSRAREPRRPLRAGRARPAAVRRRPRSTSRSRSASCRCSRRRSARDSSPSWRASRVPTGWSCVFEHNPYNPLTRLVVRRCEFGEDARMLRMARGRAPPPRERRDAGRPRLHAALPVAAQARPGRRARTPPAAARRPVLPRRPSLGRRLTPAMRSAPELSVVVLCYRAQEGLRLVVEPLAAELRASGVPYELVLVANYWNGAADLHAAACRELRRRALRRRRRGTAEGRSAWAGTSAPDWTPPAATTSSTSTATARCPTAAALDVYRRLKETGADVAKGRRYVREDGSVRTLTSLGFNVAVPPPVPDPGPVGRERPAEGPHPRGPRAARPADRRLVHGRRDPAEGEGAGPSRRGGAGALPPAARRRLATSGSERSGSSSSTWPAGASAATPARR